MKKMKLSHKTVLSLVLSAVLLCMPVAAFAMNEGNSISVQAEDLKQEETTFGQDVQKGKESETVKNACIFYMCGDRGKNVRLIIDSQYALTGALNGTKDDTCLYTGQDNFIQVFKDALRNEMQLISMQGGNGGFHE